MRRRPAGQSARHRRQKAAVDPLTCLVVELLAPLGPVAARRMFGAVGLFLDGRMLGIVAGDALFLKADAATRPMFEAEGMQPLWYERQGRQVALGYWQVPERLLDERDELLRWARIALDVAGRAAATTGRRARGKHS